jgi:L-aminopeptidase/D-esterase-like protein
MLVGLPLGSRANLARLNRVAAPSFARLPQPTAHMIEGDQLFCARPRHQAMNRALDDDCHKTRDDAALELEFAFWAGQTPSYCYHRKRGGAS